VAIKPFGNMQEMLDLLSRLSAASPLRDLLVQIDLQTQLSRERDRYRGVAERRAEPPRSASACRPSRSSRRARVSSIRQQELVSIMSEAFGTDPSGKPIEPAQRVDLHFKSLHDFVTAPEGRQAPMELMLQRMNAMYQGYNQAASAPNQNQVLLNQMAGGGGGGGAQAAQQLQDSTRDMPRPIAALGHQCHPAGAAGDHRRRAAARWAMPGGRACCRCARRRSTATRWSPAARTTCRSTISAACSPRAA
jgi:type VI protein secretion system component VasK